ncbi:MAG: 30S ribosomal protein S4e [Candidatus Thorarchaeota archaeon]
MTRLGQKRHLKRLPAPSHWPIRRKEYKFTTRVIPGPHPKEQCMTLALFLREVLGYAKTMKEVKHILDSGDVLVDSKVRKEPRYPIGIMDVIEIKSAGERFRVVPSKRYGLRFQRISEEDAKIKLCQIRGKRMVDGGRVQITLHDGRNILLPEGASVSEYRILDTLKISLPDQKILAHLPLQQGAYAIVSRGTNTGTEGVIKEMQKRYGTHASMALVEDKNGHALGTVLEYVFVIGNKAPDIEIGTDGGAQY